MLTPRWTKLFYHPIQHALWKSNKRFIVVPAGRRSGKTELAKRNVVKTAIKHTKSNDGRYILAAPTHSQARDIFWDDIRALVPDVALATPDKPWKSVSISGSTIRLWNNCKIIVAGMDKPERAEGSPIDGIVLDESGNMKKETWTEHIRPALSTPGRLGWAWLIGVPEGRNHYYQIAKTAMALSKEDRPWEESWGYYHWLSRDILPESEIRAAMEELDELTFRQEYEGSFINFRGRAYYNFNGENVGQVNYDPYRDLILCFDFNVDPGVAAVIQEFDKTYVIDEVFIPKNSNTISVCNKLLSKYISHQGRVWCYGDATGGARGTAKVRGSDWDIIKEMLHPAFGDHLWFRVGKQNPKERSRINAVNSRCKTINGDIHLVVDPKCKYTVEDFEGTTLLEGGSGEIDKRKDPMRSHITDAIGYYIVKRWPIRRTNIKEVQTVGIR